MTSCGGAATLDRTATRRWPADRPGSDLEEKLLKRVRAFAHVDDPDRAHGLLATPGGGATSTTLTCRPASSEWLECSTTRFGPTGAASSPYGEGLAALRAGAARLDPRSPKSSTSPSAPPGTCRSDLGGALADIPLKVHARYQREEILAALDFPQKPNSFREGVWYSAERNVDAFFVTLTKSEADYSPTTMYADYPISPTLFHWESQSTTSVASRLASGTSRAPARSCSSFAEADR